MAHSAFDNINKKTSSTSKKTTDQNDLARKVSEYVMAKRLSEKKNASYQSGSTVTSRVEMPTTDKDTVEKPKASSYTDYKAPSYTDISSSVTSALKQYETAKANKAASDAEARYQRYSQIPYSADYAEKSKYVSTKRSDADIAASKGPLSFLVPETNLLDFNDITYDYINRNEEARSKQSYADVSSGLSAVGLDNSERLEMTDDEIGIFNYLYAQDEANGDKNHTNAYQYIKDLTGELNYRQRMTSEKEWADYATEHPVESSAFSLFESPAKGLSYIGQAVDYLTDGEIDQNAGYNKFSYANSAIRSAVSDQVEQKWGKAGSFAYQTGMSMGDFLINSAITGGNEALSLAIMGSGAAADTTISAKDRGLTDDQAFALGTIAGAAEIVSEKVSFEALFNANWEDGALKYILKNTISEGAEEVESDVINLIADILISKDKSEWAQSVQSYRNQGYDESGAFWRAVRDQALNMGLDFLGGAISGGIMSGVASGFNAYGSYATGKNFYKNGATSEDINAVVNEGLSSPSFTQSYRQAQAAQQKLDAGQSLSNYELGSLFNANARAVDSYNLLQQAAYEAANGGLTTETARNILDDSIAMKTMKQDAGLKIREHTMTNSQKLDAIKTAARNLSMDSDAAFDTQMTTDTGEAIKTAQNPSEAVTEAPVNETSDKTQTQETVTKESPSSVQEKTPIVGYSNETLASEFGIGANETLMNAAMNAVNESTKFNIDSLGEKGKRAYQKYAGSAQDITAFNNAFKSYYDAGQVGIMFEDVPESYGGNIERSILFSAFSAGKNDSSAKAQSKITVKKKTAQKSGKQAQKRTTTFTDNRTDKSASDVSKADIDGLKRLSKMTKVDIVLQDTIPGPDGSSIANGYYQNGVVYIAADSDNPLLTVAKHEITHHIQKVSPKKYQEYKNYVMKAFYKNSQQVMNWEIQRRIDLAAESDIKLTRSEAMDEIVADATETFLTDPEIINELARENKSLAQTILDAIREFISKIENAISNLRGYSDFMTADELKKAEKLWVAALADASETTVEFKVSDGKTVVETNVGDPVAVVQKDGNAVFSLKTYDEEGRDYLKTWLDKRVAGKQISRADADSIIDQMEEYYKVCNEFISEYAPFGAWSNAKVVKDSKGKPVFSVIKANGEYSMNLDFSLVCKKRRTLDAVFDEMINRGIMDDADLSEAEISKINSIIRDNGFETACALCFVDSKRYRQAKVADNFVDQYNDLVKMLLPEDGSVSAHYFDFIGTGNYKNEGAGLHTMPNADLKSGLDKLRQVMNENGSKTVPYKIAKHLLENPADRKLVSRSEFMNTTGFEAVKVKNPSIMKLYNSSKGSGGPKAAFSDVQYLSDILKKNAWTPAKAYAVGGVRIQSFSDYIPRMVFDYIQMIGDLSAKNLPAHAYTKEAMFAKQFGMTGIKVNLSLVPSIAADGVAPGLDANGDYLWYDGQSFGSDVNVKGSGQTGFKLAVEIQNATGYSENCGTIAVGVSDQHIWKMLDDPDIRMIIPYHKSSLNHIVAVMNNIDKYTDYTDVQNTRYKDTGSKITTKDFNYNEALRRTGDAKAAASEYLAWCEKNGYLPKFDTFASHENYYKLLEDFATYDNGKAVPQGPVTMTFPKDGDAFGSMSDLIKEGLEEDAILEAKREKSIPGIVDQIESVLKKKDDGKQFSDNTSGENVQYSLREKDPPKKTGIAYKVFMAKDGELFPPMVANPGGVGTPVGVWLDADIGQPAPPSKTGRPQVQGGGKGTNSGKISLAFRPGWHLGDIPLAKQFAKLNPDTGKKELFPANFVWAECEYAMDVDYQDEAMSYGYTESGKFRHSYAGLPKLPEDGYYRYRTNPNPDTVPWVITGAMKVKRILTDAETDAICRENGVEPMKRQGGPIDLSKFGLKAGDTDTGKQFSLKDSKKSEDDLNRLRYERSDLESQIDFAYMNGLSDSEVRKLENRLVKVNSDIDSLVASERRAAVKTSMQDILDNLSKYRRSDLESLAEQISDGVWDGYEELSRAELEDALREEIQNREYSPLEMQSKKYGLYVMPVDTQFQLKETDRLIRDNERLREVVDELRSQFKTTTVAKTDKKSLDKFTRNLLKDYNSDADMAEVRASLDDLFTYMANGEDGDPAVWTDVFRRAYETAKYVLQNVTEVNDDIARDYSELRKTLRTRGISISKEYDNDLIGYDSINDFRKKNMGRIKITKDGLPIDVAYAEFADLYPGLFNVDEHLTPPDQLMQIEEVLNSIEPVEYNPYERNMRESATWLANDIIERFYELPQAKPTFADKAERQLTEQKIRDQKKIDRLREQKNERIKQLIQKNRDDVKNAQAKERQKQTEKYTAQIEALKEKYQKRIADIREDRDAKIQAEKQKRIDERNERKESADRTKLLKIAKRLQNLKTTEANRALINQFIGDLDTTAKSLTDGKAQDLRSLRDWYDDQKLNNPDFIPDQHIEKAIARLSQKHIKELSIDEVRDLTDVLLNIENEIRTQRKMIDSKERRDIYQMGIDIIDDVKSSKGSKPSGPKSVIDRYITTESLSPIRQIRRMTGYVDNDPMYKLANELADGQRKMFDFQREANDLFKQWTEDKAFVESIAGKKAKEIKISGISANGPVEVTITPAMRMSLYLHSKNSENMRHIAGGGVTIPDIKLYKQGKLQEAYDRGTTIKLTPSEVRAIASQMSSKEKAFADAASKYFNGMSQERINKVSEKLKGYSLAKVDQYFPINTDTSFTKKEFDALKFDGTIEGMGFLKERVNSSSPIYLRDMNQVLLKSIDQTSRYVGLAIPVRNFNKAWGVTKASFNDDGSRNGYESSVQQAVRAKWGEDGYNYIENLMLDVNGGRSDTSKWNKALGKIRSNYAGAVLTLNMSVAMKQAASYPSAAAVLGWKPIAKAMKDFGKVDMNTINKYTPLLWYRMQGFSTQELGDMAKQDKSLPKVLNWVQGMDVVTTKKLWKASEYYVRENSQSLQRGTDDYYKAVADIYNRVIEETQPNYTTMQRPQILRSQDTLLQNLVMFKTQPLQNFGILYDSAANLVAKSKQNSQLNTAESKANLDVAKTDFARSYSSQFVQLLVFAGMTFAWNLFRGKTGDYDDDETEEMTIESVLKGIGRNMITGASGMVPFGDDFYEFVRSKVTGEKYYGMEPISSQAISDSLTGISKLADTISGIGKSVLNDEPIDWPSVAIDIDDCADSITKLFGIPYENITNMVNAAVRQGATAVKGKYVGEYIAMQMTASKKSDTSKYADLIYRAYRAGDKESYNYMLKDMVANGVDEETLMEKVYNKAKVAVYADARRLIDAGKSGEARSAIRKLSRDFEKDYSTVWKSFQRTIE